MREPAGELADGLHLLALAQGLLGDHQFTRARRDALLQRLVQARQLRALAQAIVDVGVAPYPARNAAVCGAKRHRPHQEPAILAIVTADGNSVS